MAQERRMYSREFKQEAVRLARGSGKSTSQIARDLGIDPKPLYRWKHELQANGEQAFRGFGHLPNQEEEMRRLRRDLAVVEQERDISKKGVGDLLQGMTMIYRFIQEHRQAFPVAVICRVLGVARSGYYAWQRRPISQRERTNSQFVKEIRAVHAKSRQTYGSPRVFAELRANKDAHGRDRVTCLMRQHGIVSQRQRRFKTTTNSQHAYPIAPNLLRQPFVAEHRNQTWVADITYVQPTRAGSIWPPCLICTHGASSAEPCNRI